VWWAAGGAGLLALIAVSMVVFYPQIEPAAISHKVRGGH
jgi:hypothetical protein